MRTAIITILLAIAGVCFAINNQLANGGHGVYAEYYFIAGILFSLAAVILAPIFAINWKKATAVDNSSQVSALPKNPALRKAVIRLQSIYDHLSKEDLSETYVNDYHAILDTVQAEIHQDLSSFRIPRSELRTHLSGIAWEGGYKGWQTHETKDLFCPPDVFRIALSGALNFIKTYEPSESPKEVKARTDPPSQLPTAAPPQATKANAYEPDETDKQIIRYLYRGYEHLHTIAEFVGLDLPETQLRLNRLVAGKFVKQPITTPLDRTPKYRLSDKGTQYAIDHGLRDSPAAPKKAEADVQRTEPDVYEPDKTAIEILKQIKFGNAYESQIADALKIDNEQIREPLSLLEKHGYIALHRPTDRGPYYLLTEKGDEHLKKPVRLVPFPSGHDMLDETLIKILVLIASPDHDHHDIALANYMNIHPERMRHYLSKLEQHGYVYSGIPMGVGLHYYLTDKARGFLIDRNLI